MMVYGGLKLGAEVNLTIEDGPSSVRQWVAVNHLFVYPLGESRSADATWVQCAPAADLAERWVKDSPTPSEGAIGGIIGSKGSERLIVYGGRIPIVCGTDRAREKLLDQSSCTFDGSGQSSATPLSGLDFAVDTQHTFSFQPGSNGWVPYINRGADVFRTRWGFLGVPMSAEDVSPEAFSVYLFAGKEAATRQMITQTRASLHGCPAGRYYNNRECVECPIGRFRALNQRLSHLTLGLSTLGSPLSCTSCPDSTTTRSNGSKALTDCNQCAADYCNKDNTESSGGEPICVVKTDPGGGTQVPACECLPDYAPPDCNDETEAAKQRQSLETGLGSVAAVFGIALVGGLYIYFNKARLEKQNENLKKLTADKSNREYVHIHSCC